MKQVQDYDPMVQGFAKTFVGKLSSDFLRYMDYEDLVQEGYLSLLEDEGTLQGETSTNAYKAILQRMINLTKKSYAKGRKDTWITDYMEVSSIPNSLKVVELEEEYKQLLEVIINSPEELVNLAKETLPSGYITLRVLKKFFLNKEGLSEVRINELLEEIV